MSFYEYFAAWRDDGTSQRLLDTARHAVQEPSAPSGAGTPSAAAIDSQAVKTTERVGVRGLRRRQEDDGP